MRVIDTSAWIEIVAGSTLALRLTAELPAPEDCIVPTLVQHELAKWLTRERSPELAQRVIAYTLTCKVIGLDTAIALQAAGLASSYRLSTADAIIYATAQSQNAQLITCDAHFDGLPGVVFFAKNTKAE